MITNHIALNLVTKGLLNISDITKGMIIFIQIVTPTKKGSRGGSGDYAYELDSPLFKKIEELDNINFIKVYVDWNKSINKNKKIEAKLIKKYIEAEILKETGKKLKVKII